MDILERIKERGYEVMKAGDYDEDNPYAINYGHLAIKTPSGNVKSIVGTLDRPLYIKDKTLCVRELKKLMVKCIGLNN